MIISDAESKDGVLEIHRKEAERHSQTAQKLAEIGMFRMAAACKRIEVKHNVEADLIANGAKPH